MLHPTANPCPIRLVFFSNVGAGATTQAVEMGTWGTHLVGASLDCLGRGMQSPEKHLERERGGRRTRSWYTRRSLLNLLTLFRPQLVCSLPSTKRTSQNMIVEENSRFLC